MVKKVSKIVGIDKAVALKGHTNDIRVVMPTKIASGVSKAIGGGAMSSLRYSESEENKSAVMNWKQIDDFSSTIAEMISDTAVQFQNTIQLVQNAGFVGDADRFTANVKVAMEDLTRFTDEFITVKTKHEGRNGFIEEAPDRMAYLAIFEDYRALAAYFQGTMHHKLIEFTEYALDAKDKLLELQKAQEAAAEAPVEEGADVIATVEGDTPNE